MSDRVTFFAGVDPADNTPAKAHEARCVAASLYNGNTILLRALVEMLRNHAVHVGSGVLAPTLGPDSDAADTLVSAGVADVVRPGHYAIRWGALSEREEHPAQTPTLPWPLAVEMYVDDPGEREKLLALGDEA